MPSHRTNAERTREGWWTEDVFANNFSVLVSKQVVNTVGRCFQNPFAENCFPMHILSRENFMLFKCKTLVRPAQKQGSLITNSRLWQKFLKTTSPKITPNSKNMCCYSAAMGKETWTAYSPEGTSQPAWQRPCQTLRRISSPTPNLELHLLILFPYHRGGIEPGNRWL